MANISDKELISRYIKGDSKSLEVLVKRYLNLIYSFVYRYIGGGPEAEDITQEVFVRVWKNIKKFDKDKSFKTWIFTIAKNACVDYFRKKKEIPFSNFEKENGNSIFDNLADSAALPLELLEQKDIATMLSRAMEKIYSKHRMVLYLRYNDHFTFKEIAESLGEPLNTVKSQHRRGIISLKKILTINK